MQPIEVVAHMGQYLADPILELEINQHLGDFHADAFAFAAQHPGRFTQPAGDFLEIAQYVVYGFFCIGHRAGIFFAESLGGGESLIEHPETMSHAPMSAQARKEAGIMAGTIRVSVGIERAEDLIADMTRAFERIEN